MSNLPSVIESSHHSKLTESALNRLGKHNYRYGKKHQKLIQLMSTLSMDSRGENQRYNNDSLRSSLNSEMASLSSDFSRKTRNHKLKKLFTIQLVDQSFDQDRQNEEKIHSQNVSQREKGRFKFFRVEEGSKEESVNRELFLRNFHKTLSLNKKQSQSLDAERIQRKKEQQRRPIRKGRSIDSQNVDESVICADMIKPRKKSGMNSMNESKFSREGEERDVELQPEQVGGEPAAVQGVLEEAAGQAAAAGEEPAQHPETEQGGGCAAVELPEPAVLDPPEGQPPPDPGLRVHHGAVPGVPGSRCTLLPLQAAHTFVDMIHLLGQYFMDINDLDKAAFFIKQALLTSDMLRLYPKKIVSLLLLQAIASNLKAYHISIKLLKKALEFCWLINDHELELHIYDQLGIRHFYLGALEEAEFLHEKFMQGITEPLHSTVRSNSITFINLFEQRFEYDRTLSRVVLNRLALPILNKFDYIKTKNTDGTITKVHPMCDQFKMTTYQNSKAKTILKFLVKTEEYQLNEVQINNLKKAEDFNDGGKFKKFKLIDQGLADDLEQLKSSLHIKEKHKTLFIYHGKAPHTWIPQEILRIKLKHRNERIQEQKLQIQKILKVELGQLISQRKVPCLEEIYSKLHDPENRKQNDKFEKQEQIYIKHLNRGENGRLEENAYLEKYKNLINEIIEGLV